MLGFLFPKKSTAASAATYVLIYIAGNVYSLASNTLYAENDNARLLGIVVMIGYPTLASWTAQMVSRYHARLPSRLAKA
jgi:hypothetical protein